MVSLIESYNLKEQKWVVEGELNNYRLKPTVIAYEHKIYVLGGLIASFKDLKYT
jgi:hypothetical protein